MVTKHGASAKLKMVQSLTRLVHPPYDSQVDDLQPATILERALACLIGGVRCPLPPRSMVGQLTLDQHIGVRIPGGQPIQNQALTLTKARTEALDTSSTKSLFDLAHLGGPGMVHLTAHLEVLRRRLF
jgi:hypothetical protein